MWFRFGHGKVFGAASFPQFIDAFKVWVEGEQCAIIHFPSLRRGSKRKHEWSERKREIIENKDRKCTFSCGWECWITHHYTYLEIHIRTYQLVHLELARTEPATSAPEESKIAYAMEIDFFDEIVFLHLARRAFFFHFPPLGSGEKRKKKATQSGEHSTGMNEKRTRRRREKNWIKDIEHT